MQKDELLELTKKQAEDGKALEIMTFDMRSDAMRSKDYEADLHLICSGTSTAHVKGIASQIEMALKKNGIYALSIEGREENNWVLLDYYDVIVHVFLEEERERIQLEALFQGKE